MSDRLYVIERLGGKFQVDGGIWQENSTGRADRVGEITKVHDDHIIGRVKHSGKQMRFNFMGGRFDDVDGNISQAIEKIVEQPAQPDRLYVVEESDGKFRVDRRIWREGETFDGVGRIVEVHDDHIIGLLDDGEPMRFDFVDEVFYDSDGDRSQAIEPAMQVDKPAQPQSDRLYIVEHTIDAIAKGYTGSFSPSGFIWKEDPDGDNAKFMGRVVEVHSNYILGRLDNVDEIVRFDFVGERFKDVDEEPSQEIVRHVEQPAVQAEEKQPAQPFEFRDNGSFVETDVRLNITNNKFKDCSQDDAVEVVEPTQPEEKPVPAVGQYVFEDGKFFGEVVKGDNEHIRIDGLDDYKCWFSVSNETRQRFKFFSIKPGMWLAPKTLIGVHKLIERIDTFGDTKFPIVVMEDGGSIYFDGAIKYYDILTQKQEVHERLSEIGKTILPKYLSIEKDWVVDDEFETQIHVGDAVFLKDTGKVIGHVTRLRDDNQLDIKFSKYCPADLALGSSIRCYNPRMLLRERKFGFHRSGQFGSDLDRVGYILDLDKKQLAEQKEALRKLRVEQAYAAEPGTEVFYQGEKIGIVAEVNSGGAFLTIDFVKPGPYDLHGRNVVLAANSLSAVSCEFRPPAEPAQKVCPKCNSLDHWRTSIRSENGTDFCMACHIWWTSSNPSKPIAQQPAQPFLKEIQASFKEPTQSKLEECGVSDTEAWINRNRPPVDLHNGDTIVTNDGIYRLHDNKWVKVAGKLRVRCHESIVDDSRNVVEYKFVSDPLLIKERNKHFEDAVREVREILGWSDHMSDLRPKGKPISLARSMGEATARNLNEIIRKQIDDGVWDSIVGRNTEETTHNEDS